MEKRYGLVTDYSGNVVPGSTITVTNYPAGTIATLFSDNAGTSKPNPFVANDADGRYTFYAADGRYRIDIAPPLDANLSASSVIDVILSDTAYLQKASKAEVAALPLTQYDAGKKVLIASDDGKGSSWTIKYNATPGTYVDNGSNVIVPTGGDGTIGIVRDTYQEVVVGPSSGSYAGPYFFNHQTCTFGATVTGTAGVDNIVHGWQFNMNVGGANYDGFSAKVISAALIHLENDTSNSDKVGTVSAVYSAASSPGKIYGNSPAFTIDSGGSCHQAIGTEVDVFIQGTGSLDVGLGFNAWAGGANQASQDYAAYAISKSGAGGTAAWKTGFLLYTDNATLPQGIDATGDLFKADGAHTLANILNFSNVTVTGNILNFPNATLSGAGVFAPGSSGGVDFSANDNAAGMTSELLDDYEEGTFTPVISDLTNDATAIAVGRYTKIGRQVHIKGRVILSSLGSVSGNVYIKGFPFPAESAGNLEGVLNIGRATGMSITAGQSACGYIITGQSHALLQLWDATTGTTDLQHTELTATSDIIFDATYYV